LSAFYFVFLRPFNIVEGSGFRDLAQKLINIGHQYGSVPVDSVLPCATTVSRHVQSVLQTEKKNICRKLRSAANLGLTTDAWTNEMTTAQYVTITLHFIDRNWKTNSVIAATREDDERHTAENIKKLVRDVLDEYKAYRNGMVFVTDNAANMKAAFRDEIWIGCAGHNLNLDLSHGLQKPKNDCSSSSEGLPTETVSLISTCKELVTLGKRTKLNRNLDKTLKQCISTRWNSVLSTLQSVNENLVQLRAVAADKDANKNLIRLYVTLMRNY
jgi:hypothetical protein